jgi:hypothetical protein
MPSAGIILWDIFILRLRYKDILACRMTSRQGHFYVAVMKKAKVFWLTGEIVGWTFLSCACRGIGSCQGNWDGHL